MNEEYLETFNGPQEEIERYNLRKEIESKCIPHYAEEIKKTAKEIVDSPPGNFEDLLEASKKMRTISDKVQVFSEFLDKSL